MTRFHNEGNWYRWRYGDDEPFGWPNGEVLRHEYDRYTGPHLPYREALEECAQSIVDHHPGEKIQLFFSGGVDSELMLRAFQAIRHPVTVNVFRYENDINRYDVDLALRTCAQLHVVPNIIDVALQHYYETDALDDMDAIGCSHARAMIQSTFCRRVEDGVCLFGDGDPLFRRMQDDYSVPCEWTVQDIEYNAAWIRAGDLVCRNVIMFLRWHPAVISGQMELQWFKDLTSDKMHGKLGVNSTKLQGFREAYPDLEARTKVTGLESAEFFIAPVQESHNKRHAGNPPYSQDQQRTLSQFQEELWGKSET